MADYINSGLEADPATLADEAFGVLATEVPGWEPLSPEPDTIILEETSAMAAEVRDVASEVMDDIFRYFGPIAGIIPTQQTQATVPSTWTAQNNAGYTIEEGWVVGIQTAGDAFEYFEVQADVVIAPGSTATTAGEVILVQQEGSIEGNGLGGVGEPATLIESVPYAFTIVTTALSSGGSDAESDESYLSRLRTELQLQSPRPILPNDFAVLAKRISGADRALAIDLYKPVDQPLPGDLAQTNRPRSITIAMVDADGAGVSAPIKAAVVAYLKSLRESTFEVWAIDPTFTTVDVSFTAVAFPGYDAPTVQAAAIAAVEDYLSAANWGLLPYSDERVWITDDKVRYLEVAEVLNRVDGLRYVTALTLGPSGGPLTAADFTLSGVAPMPVAGSVLGTVSA